MKPPAAAAFDGAAQTYDQDFPAGDPAVRLFRAAIWARADRHFPPGARVLDLGCGTGEDALHLAAGGRRVLAVDISRGMLEMARAGARALDLEGSVRFVQARAGRLPLGGAAAGTFQGAVSSFGPLNCEPDLEAVAGALGRALAPGGVAILAPLARVCPWEIAVHLVRLRPRQATARLWRRHSTVGGVRIAVRYPSVSEWRRLFEGAGFRLVEARSLGGLVPPPGISRRLAAAVPALAAIEQALGGAWPLNRVGDHHLLVFRRGS